MMRTMRKLSKAISLAVALVLCLSLSAPAFASTLQSEYEHEILLSLGYTEPLIEAMSRDNIDMILEQYAQDPSKISVSVSVTNFSEENTSQPGISPAAEGTLTSDILYFALTTMNQNGNGPHGLGPAQYVMVTFNWKSLDWSIRNYQDKVVVAWGGNLLQTPGIQNISYYEQLTGGGWRDFVASVPANYTESAINAGGYYYFDIRRDAITSAKLGTICFYLSDNTYTGETVKIVAQYAHQVSNVDTDITISYPPALTLNIGDAYETSPQLQRIFTR